MKEPFNGKVKPRLVYKRFKDCVFYYVTNRNGQEAVVEPCVLRYAHDFLMVTPFDKNWKLENFSHHFSWENLFFDYNEAKSIARERNSRIS
jgi:hypothetical protein